MAERPAGRYRHFILESVTETEQYRYPGRGNGQRSAVPPRDRPQHSRALRDQLATIRNEANAVHQMQRDVGIREGLGLHVEFESFPDVELAFESLARERQRIELLNVRHDENKTQATVFVPEGKLDHFEALIRDYLAEKRDSIGRIRDNRRLIDAIRKIRTASLRALWTDADDVFPSEEEGSIWWEVWLPVRSSREATFNAFCQRAEAQDMQVAKGVLIFPERIVVLVSASLEQMQRSMLTLNSIAELRRAKETADFFDSLRPEEQFEWLEYLLSKTQFAADGDEVSYVCLLDTGVNRGHPLLMRSFADDDLHTVEPGWGIDDADGHGTEMAGLALVGNITQLLVSSASIQIEHRLESVKLLPTSGVTGTDPHHHGYLTTEAVARPEVTDPKRHRVFAMAVTASDNRDRGRPSAWSAAIDSLAADVNGYGASSRLIVVSAGNVVDPGAWRNYPYSNDTDEIHDPAQSWNALTVGAYTNLASITEQDAAGFEPVASNGGLSPFSTTSLNWERHWPLKPDIVLEGGNAARDSLGAVQMPSLCLLTSYYRPLERPFTATCGTSAATAMASRMAAQVVAEYPELWPETVRGLIVHSAEWTQAMRTNFLPEDETPTKSDYLNLLRRCGFGVPHLERAIWSVKNSLTMVVEASLRPFKRDAGKVPTLCDMHVHELPWPRDVLQELGEVEVEMRVTLSYFVEPNPSRRGVRSRYRYESHGLRFDVKRPLESTENFRKRLNLAARDENEGTTLSGDDPSWLIGKQGRHRGSLHGDIWRGTAASLASRGAIAVYPTTGWWKTRPPLKRFDQSARYALIVSIRAPEIDVNLYAEVQNAIRTPIAVET